MRSVSLFSIAAIVLIPAIAPKVAMAQTLTENFSTLDHWDATATAATGSAGVWNINATGSCPCAMAPVMDNGDVNNAIDFGDGSDGVLTSSSGYTFDTNAHPNGYNFISVNITGGTVTVTGSNPLIIRSLTTVNITPTIDVDGGTGGASASGGSAGAAPPTSLAAGGAGGSVAGGTGGTGDLSSGTSGGGAGGAGCGAGTCGKGGQSLSAGIAGDFDASGGFTAGGAGGGGGGNSASATAGGGGGAGGGAIQITAIGSLTVGNISANGGAGGSNATTSATCAVAPCSGIGAGGNGGSIWLQSFSGITVATINANQGAATGTGNAGEFGNARGDEPSAPAAWTTGGAGAGGATGGEVPALASSGTYYLVSTPYDLETSNAIFTSTPTVTPSSAGTTVQYAASTDGSSFSGWSTDITTLSNQSYRYLKFKVVLNAATQNYVSSISIPYSGPSLDSADLSLAAGCGALERPGDDSGHSDGTGLMMTGLWVLFYLLAWRWFKAFRPRSAGP